MVKAGLNTADCLWMLLLLMLLCGDLVSIIGDLECGVLDLLDLYYLTAFSKTCT
jgi:hypothetical protein